MSTTIKRHITMWRYAAYMGAAILFLCGLTLALSSCQKENIVQNVVPGEKVAINFTLGSLSYSAGEDITRSPQAEPQLRVVSLGDGLYMYATLEPNAAEAATRADGDPIDEDTEVCVLAFNALTNLYVASAIYTASSGISLYRAEPFEVEAGQTYRFVAYAYHNDNHGMVSYHAHDDIMRDGTGFITNIPPYADMLWGEMEAEISENNTVVEIPVRHLFARVNRVEAVSADNVNISLIDGVKLVSYSSDLKLAEGTLFKRTTETDLIEEPIDNAKWGSPYVAAPQIEAEDLNLTVYPDGGTMVKIGRVTVAGYNNNLPFENVSTTFTTDLEEGKSYTLRLTLTTKPADPPVLDVISGAYVGAFWKADERGERVIRIPVSGDDVGPWTAAVVYTDGRWNGGHEDISLARGGSPDSQIYTANPGNAENYIVVGPTNIDGDTPDDGYIRLRIGLKQTFLSTGRYSPTANNSTNWPARYALVDVYYGPGKTKVHRIFLRQGEGADYLMSPTDGISSGGASGTRDAARRFLPYNLTATTLNSKVDVPGATPAVNPGRLTDYPTQAGAFFQYASNTGNPGARFAFSPVGGPPSHWNNGGSIGLWNSIYATHETCPPGYRRPNDGSTTGYVTPGSAVDSEIRQSLWYRPQADNGQNQENAHFGLYADGYFDRMPLTDPSGTVSTADNNSTVAAGTNSVAYRGWLFYNPLQGTHLNASVFFPAAGHRIPPSGNGALDGAGTDVRMLTSSLQQSDNNWQLFYSYGSTISANTVAMQSTNARTGQSIRCVSEIETCIRVTGVTLSSEAWESADPSSTNLHRGMDITFTANIVPPHATFVYYKWEENTGSGWVTIEDETGPEFTTTVALGTRSYRVTASNNCQGTNTAVSNVITIIGTLPPN